jgi:diguanylate cyclase (GGDEF)-like protein
MFESRFIYSPIFVLFAGLASAVFAVFVIYAGMGLASAELGRTVSIGAFTACGGATMATWQRFASRKAAERLNRAAYDAKHDPLTGLVNRIELYRALDESLAQAKQDQTVFGVLFMDLDRFKVINDSLGHDAGDELLMIVADRLRAATRSTDVVARLGGDEFVVICRGLHDEESVTAVASQVLERLGHPVLLNGRRQMISASVGIAIADWHEERGPDELIRDADSAMYQAKKDRGGYCVFDDAQRNQLVDRLDIERDLGRAIDEKQLQVFYQPIVIGATGELYGFEALVRWDHPERGFIGPDDFLPIAEDALLMANLGELVLREACAQAAVWNHLTEQATNLHVSVNLAAQQLTNPELPDTVAEVLEWSGLEAGQLVVEVTERLLVDHLDALSTMRKLKGLGLHLAIDDFGTGQTPLTYLKQFDMISAIKIDRSFVDDMHASEANLAIIEAITAAASTLGQTVVAKGVEDHDQVRSLAGLGVHLMQGFLFAQPLPAETVGNLDGWFERGSLPGLLTPNAVSRGLTDGQLPLPAT